jgi:CRISPR-associated protein Csc3
MALLLPLCLDVKVVASESPLPLPIEANELPETVFFDGAHTFVGRLLGQERLNIDQLLPALQRLAVVYFIQMDAYSGMGRTGFDYRWREIPTVARNLASSPLYAFHYLKKWQRQQGLGNLPAGKTYLYLLYVENYLDKTNNGLSQARQLTMICRQFYLSNRSNPAGIVRLLNIAAKTILNAGEKLIDDREALTRAVFDELRRRLARLRQNKQAFYPKGSKREERREAMRRFADYLVNTVYFETLKGDPSALRGKQFNLLSSACEAVYRYESAREWIEQDEPEFTEA